MSHVRHERSENRRRKDASRYERVLADTCGEWQLQLLDMLLLPDGSCSYYLLLQSRHIPPPPPTAPTKQTPAVAVAAVADQDEPAPVEFCSRVADQDDSHEQ